MQLRECGSWQGPSQALDGPRHNHWDFSVPPLRIFLLFWRVPRMAHTSSPGSGKFSSETENDLPISQVPISQVYVCLVALPFSCSHGTSISFGVVLNPPSTTHSIISRLMRWGWDRVGFLLQERN